MNQPAIEKLEKQLNDTLLVVEELQSQLEELEQQNEELMIENQKLQKYKEGLDTIARRYGYNTD